MHVYNLADFLVSTSTDSYVCAVAAATMLKDCRHGVKHKTIIYKMLATGF